jgi:hypothetical protein
MPTKSSEAPATGTAHVVLPYERLAIDYGPSLLQAFNLRPGERLLVLRPFGWQIDGQHIPNAYEHFSRESICREHRWVVVCDYGPYIAIVRPDDAGSETQEG